ncbi:DUF305 domain-containing protein [Campylobacter sp. RM12640]|uniref:CopM family metallochaperone n=1 Tax=unclassified Campylobacter TaxID=2593542 RepID=UPI001BD968CA|nr:MULTISPECIES: DUF305 domain-containing protein [unclassified Campylobacter]MBZ7975452.1 DUF305 domain-containing protein [Campylobacter sp. RM12637]MBZ7977285.1 DUF305 domain-containing protein [Campylobacter sp. RM12654]MBZ7979181.1 DUF305 domain-containing protein [Campylobacter sp. RM12642]MBZ7981797.1 DUF305 domain-containing protein [Campylobacter sp. RM12640]MBZ7984565.1 DUF305 domain-containing protein [Campylobacter sp. RM12647]MBZ7988675.1 DUF305 domain-containing protein [Campylo
MKKIFLCLCLGAFSLFAKDLSPQELNDMKKELNESMMKMHSKMQAGMNENDPDIAFVAGMLPHHIGAVDMAKIVLKYGEDENIKKLANDIIKAQEIEIKFMQEYLEKKGYKYPEAINHHQH